MRSLDREYDYLYQGPSMGAEILEVVVFAGAVLLGIALLLG